jgi:hypothetical protein
LNAVQGDPYRFQSPVIPEAPTWWAGGIARVALGLSALLWIGMLVGAYFRETWGVIGAQLAIGPTGFGIGCLVLARRTRYVASPSARIVAPLACGAVVGLIVFLLLSIFFGAAWRHL